MTSSRDALWLDLRECQKALDAILKSNLIQRQATASARREAQGTFCRIQERVDNALYYLEHKRDLWYWRIRRAICGDKLRGKVERLLKECKQLEGSLKKGATPDIEIHAPTPKDSIRIVPIIDLDGD